MMENPFSVMGKLSPTNPLPPYGDLSNKNCLKYNETQIPKGKHCNDCVFLRHYKHNLVNLFGDETGNIDEGYMCDLFGCLLQEDSKSNTYNGKIEKCLVCLLKKEELNFLALAIYVNIYAKKR